MKMIKPPKNIQLGGHTIKVQIRKNLHEEAECYGRWIPGRNLIELQQVNKDMDQSYQNQTFWHEVVHAMLEIHCYKKYSEDEDLVDRMGQALHQVMSTMNYED